jgi:hypothetical protein
MFFKLKEHLLKRLLIATSLGLLTSLCTMHVEAATNQKKTMKPERHPTLQ